MKELKVTKIQNQILLYLGQFKYLTLSQLLKLGSGTTQYKYLWKQTSALVKRSRPLIEAVRFNTIDRIGRVEDIYYLTKYGAKVLADTSPNSPALLPKGRVVSAKDYTHKIRTLDFQIETYLYCRQSDLDLVKFLRYFDKTGNNRVDRNLSSLTKVKFKDGKSLIPDGLFVIEVDDFERLLLFELHLGKDSKRIFNQLIAHIDAMLSLKLHNAISYPTNRAYYVLVLFESTSVLESMIQRFKSTGDLYSKIHQYVLCKSFDQFDKENYTDNWKTILGESQNLSVR